MENPTHLNTSGEDRVASASDLHRLVASHTNNDNDVASERLIRLNSLYGKDAPRDHFTATSASPKAFSATDGHSLEQETYLTDTSTIESTDSEKAVKGSDYESQGDGRVMFQEATVKELGGHIRNDSSDELYRRGEEVRTSRNDSFQFATRARVRKHLWSKGFRPSSKTRFLVETLGFKD